MIGAVAERFPPRVRYWECPAGCTHRDRTTAGGNIQPTHPCRDRYGLSVPMQEAGRHGLLHRAHHIVHVPRGDYIRDETVGREQQHGVMAAHAYRPDGSHDTVVFAPTATSRGASIDA